MSRPKYKTLWLAEKRRADGLKHELRYWEALVPYFVTRGIEVAHRLRIDKADQDERGVMLIEHHVSRLDFEALGLAFQSQRRYGEACPSNHERGLKNIAFQGIPVLWGR